MALSSSRSRRYFARLRRRMEKCIRRLCCFVSDTEDDYSGRHSHALTVADLKMFHDTDVEERMNYSTLSWSSEEGIPNITYYPVFPSRYNGSDDNGTSECSGPPSECSSFSDVEGFIHVQDNQSVDSFTTASLLDFLKEMDDEDSLKDLSIIDKDDDDTLTTVSDMSDFGSDYEDIIYDISIVDLDLNNDNEEQNAHTATELLDELITEVVQRVNF